MLWRSRKLYWPSLIIFWISCLSSSTDSIFAEAASPCCFNCLKLFLSLKRVNQPLLNFNLSSSGTPAMSANLVHFCWRTSPVKRMSFAIAFETQSSSISSTLGCSVCRARFAVRSLWRLVCCQDSRHFCSSFTQDEIKGCFIWRFG